ncbi:MAG: efflux RND transporter permease subunit [Gammaproteobacteria bacterium]|nr:efflux RND transporter permease subunit [Gammaproteobacteria bacterium]NND40226.1 efflux RND transporter permease subunit [Pseudomonadales bacterium]
MTKTYGSPTVLDVFVTRPVLALVLSFVLLLVGIRASMELPVLQYPKMESSALKISTAYVGASAETVQGFITDPIERVASTVPGVDYVDSITTPGFSTVTLWLNLNQPSTPALTELSSRIDQIRFELPQGAEDPVISIERADKPQAIFYLKAVSNSLTRPQITDYLTRYVTPVLSGIEGVQSIQLGAGRNPAMRIWLDPSKLAAYNLSALDINRALEANNVISRVGSSENSEQRINLLTDATLQTVAGFERLVVREVDGTLVRLGDVARIELGEDEGEWNARYSQEDAVFLAVWPVPGANEIAIGDDLYVRLARLSENMPDGLEVGIAYDATMYMRDAIREIFITLFETVALVGLVVLALMGSVRTALVPLVAIPISLLGATAVMAMMGFSLNLLTILAIVLSVGLVVDDAIVVVENVSRYMRQGMSRTQAALASSRQLMRPIIGMTITLAAVYAPIGFLSGLTGVLFKEFAFTLAVAVLISGLVALTLSPVMSAWVSPEGGKENRATRWVNEKFDALQLAYGKLLEHIFAWRNQVLFAALFLSFLIVPFYLFSMQELAPLEDQNGMALVFESPSESSIEYTGEHMHRAIDSLLQIPGLKGIWQVITPSGGFGGVSLVPYDDREQSVHEITPLVHRLSAGVTGLRVLPIPSAPLPTAGRFQVEMVVLSSDKHADMEAYAQEILSKVRQSGRFFFVETDLQIDLVQAKFILDRDRIADLGMDVAQLSNQLGTLLSGNYVNRFDLNGKAYRVIPMIEGEARRTPEALMQLQIRTPGGALVPISSIASLEKTTVPRSLGKFQQKNALRIYGGLVPGTSKAQGLSIVEQAAAEVLPAGYAIDYAGESRQLRNEGNTLVGVLGIALVFVYFVLAVQFNSFRDPLVVLLGSVPLALMGGMLFAFLGATTINIYSQVGFITLVGLIAKNAILIVEFANHLQVEGKNKLAAIKGAAETRLRPVLMTTAATALGHFPLVLVEGAGAEARNSIGIVLVAGMVLGTVFTLFVLPCVYLLIARTHQRDETDEYDSAAEQESSISYAS